MSSAMHPSARVRTTFVEIDAAERSVSLARQSNGTLAALGPERHGTVRTFPRPPPGTSFVEIASGFFHGLARASDGSIRGLGLRRIRRVRRAVLSTRVTSVDFAAGASHSLARTSDGSLLAWVATTSARCDVPPLTYWPELRRIAGGRYHSAALRSDGTAIAWGRNNGVSATCHRMSPGLDVRRDLRRRSEHARAAQRTAASSVGAATSRFNATCRRCRRVRATCRISAGCCARACAAQRRCAGSPGLQRLVCVRRAACAGAALPRAARRIQPEPRALRIPKVHSRTASAGTSSHGCVPSIAWSGVPSIAASSGFVLSVDGVEALRPGLFFYGVSGRVEVQWGSSSTSFLCVKTRPTHELAEQRRHASVACDGTFAQDWLAFVVRAPGSARRTVRRGQASTRKPGTATRRSRRRPVCRTRSSSNSSPEVRDRSSKADSQQCARGRAATSADARAHGEVDLLARISA
jgi:hypothetical protein